MSNGPHHTLILEGKPLEEQSLEDLYMRHNLCDFILKTLSEVQDDPRKEDALSYYRGQQREIDAMIARREKEKRQAEGLPEPEPVTVNLKSARMFPKSDKAG